MGFYFSLLTQWFCACMRTGQALAANAIKNVFDPIPCKRLWLRVRAVFVRSCNPYTSEACPYSVNEEEFIHLPLLKNFILFLLTRNDGPWNLSTKFWMWVTARLKVVHSNWVALDVQITGSSQNICWKGIQWCLFPVTLFWWEAPASPTLACPDFFSGPSCTSCSQTCAGRSGQQGFPKKRRLQACWDGIHHQYYCHLSGLSAASAL